MVPASWSEKPTFVRPIYVLDQQPAISVKDLIPGLADCRMTCGTQPNEQQDHRDTVRSSHSNYLLS